jgi:hypothetical protein
VGYQPACGRLQEQLQVRLQMPQGQQEQRQLVQVASGAAAPLVG